MFNSPREFGFFWPERMELTRSDGQEMAFRPYAIGLNFRMEEKDTRAAESLRIYATDEGHLITENDALHWYAGGHDVAMNILEAFKQRVGSEARPYQSLLAELRSVGFDEVTIRIHTRWLKQGGYIEVITNDDGDMVCRSSKWGG